MIEEHPQDAFKPHVLVVDDIPANLVAMKTTIKELDCNFHCARSGNEALSMMIRNQYALVLIDVKMPEMDGLELAKLMRVMPESKHTPIIFISAQNKEQSEVYQGYEHGALDYIVKPVDKKILQYKIKACLDLHQHSTDLSPLNQKKHSKSKALQSSNIKTTPTLAKPKVLIVDDRAENLFALEQILKKSSIDLIKAHSGKEALALLEAKDFALILLDVQMPEMDGFETAKQIVAQFKDNPIPIIFITAISKEPHFILQGYESGAVDYLFKPIDPVMLVSKVHLFTSLHKNHMTLKELLHEKDHLLHAVEHKNKQLNYLAFHDPLTAVGNRRGFEEVLNKVLEDAHHNRHQCALLLLDVDHFKFINDTYGHQYGDMLLQEIPERIKKALGTDPYIARIGGDEFAIILKQTKSQRDAGRAAKKILEALTKTFYIMNKEIRINISIGITCYPEEETDQSSPNTLVKNADIAMFHAKEKHKNTFEYYTKEFSIKHNERIILENSLKFAMERNEFYLLYQPKVDMLTHKMMGVEALIRWKHPEKGMISPAAFIPILEATQMMNTVGTWVLRKAFEQAKHWSETLVEPIKIAVNVSAYQLINQDFTKLVRSLMTEFQLKPDLIELELTESAVMDDIALIRNALFELNDIGFTLSIDDFGTGYSMLSYLKKLPISNIKIDAEFIKDVVDNESSAMIVRAIIALAKNFKLSLIAEGVETKEQAEFLVSNQCFIAQGFLYSKALSPTEILEFIIKP